MSTRWTSEDIKQKGLQISGPLNSAVKVNIQPASFALGRLTTGKMNKTEIAYADLLEMRKRIGEVAWYAFEPVNLRLGVNCFYSVDFLVMLKSGELECHEVKGYWTDDALVKIRAAAAIFPFRFISKRLVKGQWETREF
jgi:hypothetical protein